ncbi:hypothetical protein [Prevotella aurantiaca]|jgi:hypothetical protein|uniref:Uncharacterized protein n=1 Tax=Prevotella aurantiaca TaxID=596085 RepID=A0A930MZP0_9BACT|nr:hypothetical protein [Prevotella aurantiaca]MBF1384461.1 hypothetical protein [Prevotella aurantiaca]
MRIESKFMRICCAFIFWVFTFCYLFFYQADILVLTQHVASNGQTHYVPWLGAILITIILQLCQVCVYSLLKLSKRGHAITYFPSVLLLTVLTSIRANSTTINFGNWIWVAPVLLILYVVFVYYIRRYEPYEPELRGIGFISQLLWINICIMLVFFLFIGIFSNSDKQFHEKIKVETLVQNFKYREALRRIHRMKSIDSTTTMLTIYSVARLGDLSDSLYEYRLIGGRDVLRPGKIHSLLLPDSVINKATKTSVHYQLAGFLLDRDLPKFIYFVQKYYPVDSLRPRYYAEAFNLHEQLKKGLKPNMPYIKGSYTHYYFTK